MRHVSIHRRVALVAAGVALLALAAFAPALLNGFLTLDDDEYVTGNPQVRSGLSGAGVRWAFVEAHASNWHPLTWIAHMADVSVFGLDPRGHHAVSIGLHALNAVALLLALLSLTGSLSRSAVVAALFAVHPLRVESVAWIAQRKDLLAGFFFFAALAAYGRYARRPAPRRYALVVLAAALGLLSKPTLVTLPFVLLLLDFWPLARLDRRRLRRRLLEKAPLLALALVSSCVTIAAQRLGGSVGSLGAIPAVSRLANAVVAYGAYLASTFWPAGLAAFYPHPASYGAAVPAGSVLVSGTALAAITAAALWWRRSQPHVFVGWFWFLGVLVPMLGLVQVGMQARADRYTYLAQVGLLIAVVWSVAGMAASATSRAAKSRVWPAVLAAAAIGALGIVSFRLTGAWRNDVALNERALTVTANNYFAHNNLGAALLARGATPAARAQFEAALAIKADYPDALQNLGRVKLAAGDSAGARADFERLVRLRRDATALQALGAATLRAGDRAFALELFAEALRIDPRHADTLNALGVVAMQEARFEDALGHFAAVLAIRPDHLEAHLNAAKVLRHVGRAAEADVHERAARGR